MLGLYHHSVHAMGRDSTKQDEMAGQPAQYSYSIPAGCHYAAMHGLKSSSIWVLLFVTEHSSTCFVQVLNSIFCVIPFCRSSALRQCSIAQAADSLCFIAAVHATYRQHVCVWQVQDWFIRLNVLYVFAVFMFWVHRYGCIHTAVKSDLNLLHFLSIESHGHFQIWLRTLPNVLLKRIGIWFSLTWPWSHLMWMMSFWMEHRIS